MNPAHTETTESARADRAVRPAFLTEADYPWLGRLIGEAQHVIGQRRLDVLRRLGEPMPFAAPKHKLGAAVAQLVKQLEEEPVGVPEPAELRATLFAAGASLRRDGADGKASPKLGTSAFRAAAVATSAHDLEAFGGDVKRLLIQRLYADIPGERLVARLADGVTPASLAVAANGAIVARHLKRAYEVTIDLNGEARRVVRQAKLRGLLCTVTRTELGVRLAVSGPLTVIRRTTYYGRALAELVPFLAWCPRFEMIAQCMGPSGPYQIKIGSGDPLPAAPAKPHFDSLVERRFAEDIGKATNDWDLIREPEPVLSRCEGGSTRLVFPDFALVRRTDPTHRWLVEIVGFWTPGYLASKLDGLRSHGSARFLLCVDERLACDPEALTDFRAVIRYKRRISAVDVLRIVDGPPVPKPIRP